MKRSFILALLFFSLSITTFCQSIIQDNIYFNSDDYILDATDESSINSIFYKLASFNEYEVQIIGHTDQDGSDSYNIALSKKRAESVKQHLIENGLLASKINIDYRGETDLAQIALDENSKQQNRRVELILKGYTYESVADMVQQLESNDFEAHSVDPILESKLTLTQGTEVTISVNSFCHMDGSPIDDGLVDITFKEAFEYLDIVDSRLFTQTEDQLLETGGMIYIEASQNGMPLRLQDGKEIELLLPAQEMKEGMELFSGAEDENGIIWEETGEEITVIKEKQDGPFIQVDLSPILDYKFTSEEELDMTLAPMLPYPNPARISYPPYRGNYDEEGYKQAYIKYEAVMAAHKLDKIDRPERLAAWQKEVRRRRQILKDHKDDLVRSKVSGVIKNRIQRVYKMQNEVSHDILVSNLVTFLNMAVGRVPYDDWYYIRKVYGESLGDVIKHEGIIIPNIKERKFMRYSGKLMQAIDQVTDQIIEKKYDLGLIDKDVLSRYVVKSSQLGWINCDRFLDFPEYQKMDLEYANNVENGAYYLIFKNIRSLIRPSLSQDKVIFKGVPKGEDVRLVVVSLSGADAYLAKQDFTIGTQKSSNLTFAAAEIADLRKVFKEI